MNKIDGWQYKKKYINKGSRPRDNKVHITSLLLFK